MTDSTSPSEATHRFRAIFADMALVFAVVYLAAAFGILTRPVGFLSAFWPANALLLGLLVRRPQLASPLNWLVAFAGFVLADLLNFESMLVTLWLTASNLAGILVGYLLFLRLGDSDRQLRRPLSVLWLFAVVALAAAGAALVGGGAATIIFGRDPITGVAFWFISEFCNYIILLPVCLTVPRLAWGQALPAVTVDPVRTLPAASLLLTMVASVVVGGPGAIVFSAPALLWCALSYSLFATAALTLLWSAWTMIATSTGILPLPFETDQLHTLMSVRLGIALLALAPLAVASINNARSALLERLEYAANHDFLTGILSRGAFFGRGEHGVAQLARERASIGVLLIDIDHFKKINDLVGHAGGDRILTAVTRTMAGLLRDGDLFGRLGGEEFAMVLPRLDQAEAMAVAERMRQSVESQVTPPQGQGAGVTISIGVAHAGDASTTTLDDLLTAADRALYVAKNGGRNRVAGQDEVG